MEATEQQHTEQTLEEALMALIEETDEPLVGQTEDFDSDEGPVFAEADVMSVSRLADSGLLTSNRGVLLRLSDGTEFQISIVQSR